MKLNTLTPTIPNNGGNGRMTEPGSQQAAVGQSFNDMVAAKVAEALASMQGNGGNGVDLASVIARAGGSQVVEAQAVAAVVKPIIKLTAAPKDILASLKASVPTADSSGKVSKAYDHETRFNLRMGLSALPDGTKIGISFGASVEARTGKQAGVPRWAYAGNVIIIPRESNVSESFTADKCLKLCNKAICDYVETQRELCKTLAQFNGLAPEKVPAQLRGE